jgi:uracil-DNA glycosylase family 4
MKSKYDKPEGCVGCSLHEKGCGFVPDKQAKSPRIQFIGEAPGKNEVMEGEPFIGKAGWVLNNWLVKTVPEMQLCKQRGEITYGNTLRCLPPEVQGRPYPKGEERVLAEDKCRQYDMIADTVHTVVLFGDSPQRCYFREELEQEDAIDKQLGHDLKGVMGRIGRVYEKDGKLWVFAPHPAYILRQPALVEHGQRALQIAANAGKLLQPEIIRWDNAVNELR